MSVLKAGVTVAALAICGATSANASAILVTPLAFDFGDIYTGATSATQVVTITNVSNVPQTPTFGGGGVSGGNFPAAQNCASITLAPGASCQFIYRFAPQSIGDITASTTILVDGEPTHIQFMGTGINPFLATATSFNFGNVAVGSSSTSQAVSITNVSNVAQTPIFGGGGVSGGNFPAAQSCAGRTFAPGESCQFIYRFAPTVEGDLTGSTSILIDGEPTSVSLFGTGGDEGASPFLLSPLAFSFGDIHLGETSPTQTVEITNVSDVPQTPTFGGGGVSGGNFPAAQNCASKTLAPGASCQFFYRFKPTVEGDLTGSTTILIDGHEYDISLDGSGLDPFLLSPLAFDFGDIDLGDTSPTQIVEITNVSDVPQTPIFGGGGVSGGNFPAAQNCAGKTLAPGASCQFFYRFAPTVEGPLIGTTTILIDGKPRELQFFGEGIGDGAPPPSVPEPTTVAIFVFGLAGLGFMRRKQII